MRVMQVYKVYRPEDFTGVPRVIHSIAEGLTSRSVETVVLATSKGCNPKPIVVDSHQVHLAKRDIQIASTSFSREAFGKFAELAQSVDIIHYHFPWPAGDLLELAHRHNLPTLVTYHSDIVKQKSLSKIYNPLMKWFLNRTDSIVATSVNYAESSPVLQNFRNKVTTIPIGLAERPKLNNKLVGKWQERLGNDFILFVGALRYYKGIRYLIEASRLTNIPIVIVGEGALETSSKAPLPDNITHITNVSDPDKEALLELCKAFILPSHLRSEAFGISLLEAARAGKPMISCEIGTGTSFVNVNGRTGITVPPADPISIKEAMEKLFYNQHLSHQLGIGARRRFMDLFTVEKMANSYGDLYQQLIEKRRRNSEMHNPSKAAL
ncbi:glycosyltransferase [Maritalea porphyrae]|uniref:Glycosyltransferase WbpZ n=1 Tax=Maritalea porphyrae TaxID=880732 RepID=A0ABQ5UU79_9HYPH|nr:glycosyltransferase [Maritalea porphyrae]GLQ18657.1 glycosyltransferase WbpZ [Maritalea porphyrae]